MQAEIENKIMASEREASAMLGISWRHLLMLEQTGQCPPAVRLGRRKLYRVETLKAWASQGCPSAAKFDGGR